jgi:hypothetical protein
LAQGFANFSLLLKPGARLLVTCPHFYILHEVPYDFWRPTMYALLYHSEKVGLRCISMEAAGGSWEVLGTVLGANLGSARAIDRTLFNRTLGFAIDQLTRAIFHLLKTRFFQRRVAWGSDQYPLYLSNVALFEKAVHVQSRVPRANGPTSRACTA